MSAHVVVEDRALGDSITTDLHDLLHERFGVEHTTIQIESEALVRIAVPGNPRPKEP